MAAVTRLASMALACGIGSGLVLFAGAADAQRRVSISRTGGEAGVEHRSERSYGRGRDGSTSTLFSEWVALPVQGTVVSPRVLAYSFMLRPSWAQQRAGEQAAAALRGLGAGASVNILAGSVIPISLHAERSSGSVFGEFGSETNYRTSTSGATMRLQNRAFPLTLDFSDRLTQSDWRSAFNRESLRRQEVWRTARLTGRSTKLLTTLEKVRFIDRVGPLSYASTGGQANHTLRWGKGSALETMADVSWRDGFAPQRRRQLGGMLRLQHAPSVASSVSLMQQTARAPTFSANSRSASYGVQYEPLAWLSASFDASGSSAQYHNGLAGVLDLKPTVRFITPLPFGGRLSGSVSAGLARRSQKFFAEPWVEVSDERHVADDERSITLVNELVDSTRVQVVNSDRTVLYLNGFDYLITRLGDLTRLTIPLSSRIVVGQDVLVSYRYKMPVQPAFETRTAGAEASLVFPGFSLQQSFQQRRSQADVASDSDLLDSGDEYSLRAALRRGTRLGLLSAHGVRRFRRNSRNDFETTELRGQLSSNPGTSFQRAVGMSHVRTVMNARDVTMITSTLAVGWMPTTAFQVQGMVESWVWSPQGLPSDRLLSMTCGLSWSLGAMATEVRYSSQQRMASGRSTQNQLFARVKRHF